MSLTIVSYPLTRENLDRMEEIDRAIREAVAATPISSVAGQGFRDVIFCLRRPLPDVEAAVQAKVGLGLPLGMKVSRV